ncbi:sugar ABC transporter permease [Alicyclobacillus fastidiosus]|uniref:Sugar ABC transporter permease n=1 Tax=Alicyclobacillus fastidiosus TaxID=392011 RepID=A0ABY6ZJM1_9BACL|nr:sugar ABC transporter permease [Alicyclobacillus fastidiosus]WAH43047.1 sugar ABC transporter permease [Alicyclobacillus fastidiosus]GMA65030.1 sugar ABC transporter permease [Alicyclobacillus fastidiosus]
MTGLKMKQREAILGYAYISPWLIGFVALTLGPLIASLYFGFTQYNLLDSPKFIGFQNYAHLFQDHDFWQSLYVTFYYAIFSVPLDLLVALVLAMMLNQKVRFMRWFRTIYYLPAVLPPVAVAILWNWILNPQYGILNRFLAFLHLPQPQWLVTPQWTVPSFIVMSIWGVGTWMITFLAGLQDVPMSLYEAAVIDGASTWKKFWHVTLPMISPVLFFNLVMGIIGAFSYFTQAFVMGSGYGGQGAGISNSGLFYALNIYIQGFSNLNMGYACALAWVLFFIVLVLTLLVFKSSSLWVYYGGEKE